MLSAPAGSHAHVLVGFRGKPVFVVAGSGLGPGVPGFTLISDEAIGGEVYASLAAKVGEGVERGSWVPAWLR